MPGVRIDLCLLRTVFFKVVVDGAQGQPAVTALRFPRLNFALFNQRLHRGHRQTQQFRGIGGAAVVVAGEVVRRDGALKGLGVTRHKKTQKKLQAAM